MFGTLDVSIMILQIIIRKSDNFKHDFKFHPERYVPRDIYQYMFQPVPWTQPAWSNLVHFFKLKALSQAWHHPPLAAHSPNIPLHLLLLFLSFSSPLSSTNNTLMYHALVVLMCTWPISIQPMIDTRCDIKPSNHDFRRLQAYFTGENCSLWMLTYCL